MARKRILVVFAKEWDRDEFSRGDYADFDFVYEGFDLFSFPSNARLLTFDVVGFIERLVRRWRGRVDGVFSNNEYFGAPIAAIVAERLGLPGTPPAVVLRAQHKYYSRLEQHRLVPEAVPDFSVFPFGVKDAAGVGLPFPLYVKPVRATYSVLARRIEDFDQLQRHLKFSWLEELIIRRLVRPFNDLMPLYTDFTIDAHHLIAETPLSGQQLNVDGYVLDGQVTFLGLCDAVMFPGTDQFERFVYPSRLPPATQERVRDLTKRLLTGMGYEHGFFNLEMFWDPATDALTLIELNPRLHEFEGQIERTLRHELAHLVAYHRAGRRRIEPHGGEWKTACADLGIPGESARHTLPLPRSTVKRNYSYACAHCGFITHRVRKFRHVHVNWPCSSRALRGARRQE